MQMLSATMPRSSVRRAGVVNLKTLLNISRLETDLSTIKGTDRTFDILVDFRQFHAHLEILIDTFMDTFWTPASI